MTRRKISRPVSPGLATRLVLFSVLATGIGQSMTFALLAPLGREVGLGEVQIGLIITCSSLVFTLTSPIWGRTCDAGGASRYCCWACSVMPSAACSLPRFSLGLKGLLTGMTLYLLAISSRVLMASLMSASPSAAQPISPTPPPPGSGSQEWAVWAPPAPWARSSARP